MNNNLKMAALIIFGVIVLYIFQTKYSDHNLNKTISACVVAQKQTSTSFDLKQAKKFCEEEIKKSLKD
jgi:hypothetical protein